MPHLCCYSSLGWALRLPGTFFPWRQDTAASRVAGRECEPQRLSHITPRQSDADRGRCAITRAHHTPTQIPSPSYKPHRAQTTPPGVWAKPRLREAKMVSDDEGRKQSNQRQKRKNSASTSGKILRSYCFQPSSDLGL